ncbi:MAG: hypothetical protein ACRDWE_09140, partial [Acidimicrobiales bacterium]
MKAPNTTAHASLDSACVVRLANGQMIVGPSTSQNPDGCHWLAVHSHSGLLLLRSTCEQWEHDPVGEMTRIAGAATRGRPPRTDLPLTHRDGETLDYGPECAV